MFTRKSFAVEGGKGNVLNAGLLLILWVLVFVASIYDFGPMPGILFVLVDILLVYRNIKNGIVVLVLIFFSPAAALQIPMGPFAVSTLILIAGIFFSRDRSVVPLRKLNQIEITAAVYLAYASVSALFVPDTIFSLKYLQKLLEGLFLMVLTFSIVRKVEVSLTIIRWLATFAGLSFFIRLAHTIYGADTALFQQIEYIDVGSDYSLEHRLSINTGGEQAVRLLWPGEEPNYTSANMIFAFGVALALFGAERGARKYFWVLMAVLIALVVIGTFSRSGFLSVLFVLFLFVVRTGLAALPALLISVAAFLYAVLDNSALQDRLLSIGSEASGGGSGRYVLWDNAIEMWSESPIFGGGFSAYYQRYGEAAHNTYIQIVAELGLIGLFLYILVLLISIAFVLRTPADFRRDQLDTRRLALAFLPGLIGMFAMIGTVTYQDVKLLWFACAISATFFFASRFGVGGKTA